MAQVIEERFCETAVKLGYAHAIGKPVIMLVDQEAPQLPFDVAWVRALFYENSIVGKGKFEQLLRKHIEAIRQKSALPVGTAPSWGAPPQTGTAV